ncbi:MAG: aminotransferase class V-fold PLP-dependent enzyme [Saprospiraceae bacterium]|nr:aminotransferase class V-fold PLP-dependent enzyme [Saprospiraceae bacterium]
MLTCQKHLFSLDPSVHYINGAYMSPISNAVAAAGIESVKKKMQPYTIMPTDFFTETHQLKSLFAQIVNAEEPQRIALIPSVSYGIATVGKNIKAQKGQNIVIAEAQFPSNVYTWRELAKEKDLQLKTVPYPIELPKGRGEAWNQRILESIDNQTAVVALSHVHWANGTKFNLKAISTRAHEVGALLIVDGTQSVGALPIDVQSMGIDALICGGYKWLMGAYSLGYAYYSDYFDNGKPLEDNWINRKGAEDFRRLIDYQDDYAPLSTRYDMGEKSNFINVSMGIVALQQLLDWGIENIQNYCRNLTKDAVVEWQKHGFWVEEQAYRGHHLFGIQMPKHVSVEKLQAALSERKIHVSVRGDFVRISPNIYNDEADIAALTRVLTQI